MKYNIENAFKIALESISIYFPHCPKEYIESFNANLKLFSTKDPATGLACFSSCNLLAALPIATTNPEYREALAVLKIIFITVGTQKPKQNDLLLPQDLEPILDRLNKITQQRKTHAHAPQRSAEQPRQAQQQHAAQQRQQQLAQQQLQRQHEQQRQQQLAQQQARQQQLQRQQEQQQQHQHQHQKQLAQQQQAKSPQRTLVQQPAARRRHRAARQQPWQSSLQQPKPLTAAEIKRQLIEYQKMERANLVAQQKLILTLRPSGSNQNNDNDLIRLRTECLQLQQQQKQLQLQISKLNPREIQEFDQMTSKHSQEIQQLENSISRFQASLPNRRK